MFEGAAKAKGRPVQKHPKKTQNRPAARAGRWNPQDFHSGKPPLFNIFHRVFNRKNVEFAKVSCSCDFLELKNVENVGEKVENTSKTVKSRVEKKPILEFLTGNFKPILNESM